jgi:(p)ppGpp synthase/HD superfamily hydrolase
MRRPGARAVFDHEKKNTEENRERERKAPMATLEKAIELAAQAHAGQKDKQDLPYILHPLRVMMRVEGEVAQMVAVLHDTIEDTALSEDDLRRAGFSEAVIAGVLACTHRRGESYTDYVIRCSRLDASRQVKLADLAENVGLDRVLVRPGRLEPDLARVRRYLLSYKFLIGQHSEAEYRSLMAGA